MFGLSLPTTIAAGLAVLLLMALSVQTIRLGNAHSDLAAAQVQVANRETEITGLKDDVKALKDKVAEQNKAIADLGVKSKADSARAASDAVAALHAPKLPIDSTTAKGMQQWWDRGYGR